MLKAEGKGQKKSIAFRFLLPCSITNAQFAPHTNRYKSKPHNKS